MIAGTYLEEMLKRRRARQLAEARERGYKQGVAEIRAELSVEIRDWNARRLKSEAKGEPFDEPPPVLDD